MGREGEAEMNERHYRRGNVNISLSSTSKPPHWEVKENRALRGHTLAIFVFLRKIYMYIAKHRGG